MLVGAKCFVEEVALFAAAVVVVVVGRPLVDWLLPSLPRSWDAGQAFVDEGIVVAVVGRQNCRCSAMLVVQARLLYR